jgi:tRNA1(Val) A37 N6-methylase TrmN6
MCLYGASFLEVELQKTFYNQEEETIEDLQLAGLSLIQKKNAFRYGMDSVLLAHFADIRPHDITCDFGTGNGILPLLLIGRNKGSHFYAFELLDESAELAKRNVKLNNLEDRIRIIHDNISSASEYLEPCSVDSIICNPPYCHPSSSLTSPNENKAIARTQKTGFLDNAFKAAFTILKGRGKIFLVYPAPQMLFIMKKMQENHLEPKRFRMVYPKVNKPANLVLIEAVKDAKQTLHPMPPLIIFENSGNLTSELKSVYHIQE